MGSAVRRARDDPPATVKRVVNGAKGHAREHTVQEALDQADCEPRPREPLEARQDLLEERGHVHASGRDKAEEHANDERASSPDRESPPVII